MATPLNTDDNGPNRPAQSNIAAAASNLHSQVNSFGNDQPVRSSNPDAAKGGFASFPARLFTTDSRDHKMALMKASVDEAGVVPNIGLNMVGPDYWDYLEKKSQMMQYADFKNWLLSDVITTSTPEAQAYWRSKFPELFEEKLNILKEQLDRSARLQKIAVLGPSDMEDFVLLYMIKRGQIQLPTGTPWTKEFIPSIDSASWDRALFNPKRFFPNNGNIKTPGFLWTNPLTPTATGPGQLLSPLRGKNTDDNVNKFQSLIGWQ
jgi:hypothetical protein